MSESDVIADRALELMGAGDHAGAEALLRPLVAQHPDCDRYVYRLGLALAGQGDRTAALPLLRRAVELHPAFGVFHWTYISELAKAEDPAASSAAYASLGGLGIAPRDAQVHFATAHTLRGVSLARVFESEPGLFGRGVSAVRSAEGEGRRGVVRIAATSGGLEIETSPDFDRSAMLVDRLLSLCRYFERLRKALDKRPGDRSDIVDLTVDDTPPPGDDPILCFSGTQPNHLLIPDSAFLGSDSYAHLRAMARAHGRPWAQRTERAYWRGSLTGHAGSLEEALALPRVAMCELKDPQLDAKLTNLDQFSPLQPDLGRILSERGVLGPREPESANFGYRYMIDIDGNSNSWPGLFLKLLTGSVVIKVASPWRQWYYDRLKPNGNLLMAGSVSELPDLIAWCRRNDGLAEQIGREGAGLVNAMTETSEFGAFLDAWAFAARPA